MSRRFGATPPPGGVGLFRAALSLGELDLRRKYLAAKQAWEDAGTPTDGPGIVRGRTVWGDSVLKRTRVAHPLHRTYLDTRRELLADVKRMLQSGSLQAVAMQLGLPGAEYVEITPEHWRALKVTNWETSEVRPRVGAPVVYKVLVYRAAAYARVIAELDALANRSRQAEKSRPIKTKALLVFDSAPESVRRTWRDRTAAARWVRDQLDGRGDDKGARRQVEISLKDRLDEMFPNSPDGRTRK